MRIIKKKNGKKFKVASFTSLPRQPKRQPMLPEQQEPRRLLLELGPLQPEPERPEQPMGSQRHRPLGQVLEQEP